MDDRVEALLRAEADHCYRWSNVAHVEYGVHSHQYRKILYVAQGSITFAPTGEPPLTLHAGDRIELPPGKPHGALVGEEGVVCWEGQG